MAFNPFSIFTGSAYDEAAGQQRDYLSKLLSNIQTGNQGALQYGLTTLQGGQNAALGQVESGIGRARGDISGAVSPAVQALLSAQGGGVGALQSGQEGGLAALRGGVEAATSAYDPLAAAAANWSQFGGMANQAQADALGLNGPEGVARAQAMFKTGPGYEFQVGQGIDALTRAANAAGMAAGGNALRQAQTYGQGQAEQQWNNWLSSLLQQQQLYNPLEEQARQAVATGRANAALTGGTGAANIYTGTGGRLADLLSGVGTNVSNVYLGAGKSLADLAKTGGLSGADIYSAGNTAQANLIQNLSQANQRAALETGLPFASTYGAQAAADTAAAGNLWGLGLQGLKMAAGGGFLPTGGFTPWKV